MFEFFEKISVFNNIMFDERKHKYTIDGMDTISVTKVTGAAVPEFDEMKISRSSARKRLIAESSVLNYEPPKDEIEELAAKLRAEWKMTNKISNEKGTAIHKYIECALANKYEYYPESHMRYVFGGTDPVKDKYDRCIAHVNKFISDIKGKMYPVKSEVVIGSPEYLVCGMVDQIFYNKKSGMFEIWDWKTNSSFETTSDYSLKPPVSHLKQCKLDEYSLQIACYKKMFQEMTGIPIGNCWLCWFNENEDDYRLFKCKELPNEAAKLMQQAKIMMENGKV